MAEQTSVSRAKEITRNKPLFPEPKNCRRAGKAFNNEGKVSEQLEGESYSDGTMKLKHIEP